MQCIGSSFWQAAPVPTVTANLALSSFCLTANNRQTFCLTNNNWIKTWGRAAGKYILSSAAQMEMGSSQYKMVTIFKKKSGLSICKKDSPEGQCAKLLSSTTICESIVRSNNFQKLQKKSKRTICKKTNKLGMTFTKDLKKMIHNDDFLKRFAKKINAEFALIT